jgi:hypothetical protein
MHRQSASESYENVTSVAAEWPVTKENDY